MFFSVGEGKHRVRLVAAHKKTGRKPGPIEARLREKLTPEALELLEKYQECSEKLYLRECDQEFLSGFRLGGRLMVEILED